jgi:hypothetical protein
MAVKQMFFRLSITVVAIFNLALLNVKAGEANTNTVTEPKIMRWENQQKSPGLSLAVQLSKTKFEPGESIVGEIILRNAGHNSVSVYLPGLQVALTRILKPTANGAPPPLPQPLVFSRSAKGTPQDSILIEPGEFFGRRFSV